MTHSEPTNIAERVSRLLGPVMFCLSVAFLVVVAVELTLIIGVSFYEVPLSERASSAEVSWVQALDRVRYPVLMLLAVLLIVWACFPLETLAMWILRRRFADRSVARSHRLSACLFPPLRIGVRNEFLEGKVWLPGIGWHTVNNALRRRVERFFSIPMIVIALLILPVLVVEWRWSYHGLTYTWLKWSFLAATGLIWFAFALEFVVMFSIAGNKLKYCRKHWLDLAIIVLPLISFLRSLRIVRALRLARFAKAHQLARVSRLYRMRGVALRAYRAIMVLEVVHRLLRIKPERQLARLKAQLAEKELELEMLREDIDKLETRIETAAKSSQDEANPPTTSPAKLQND